MYINNFFVDDPASEGTYRKQLKLNNNKQTIELFILDTAPVEGNFSKKFPNITKS